MPARFPPNNSPLSSYNPVSLEAHFLRYLITGGARFIGSHLADHLLAADAASELTLLDNLSTGSYQNIAHLENNPRVRLLIGSVLDEDLLEYTVRDCGAIFHLASAAGAVDRDDREGDECGAATGQPLPQAGADYVHERSVWQVDGGALSRGWRSGHGRDGQAALGVRVGQGPGGIPGAGALPRDAAAGDAHAAVQHGRAAPDRALRHGAAHIRAAGPERQADHCIRRRAAGALLLPRGRCGRRAGEVEAHTRGAGRGREYRHQRRGDDPAVGAARERADEKRVGNPHRAL